MTRLWNPIRVGNFTLPHRLAMAPMTRSRAKPDGTPGDLAAEYYGSGRRSACSSPKARSRPTMARDI